MPEQKERKDMKKMIVAYVLGAFAGSYYMRLIDCMRLHRGGNKYV